MDNPIISDTQRFYQDSTIFLTGGSGFLGKLIIAKLLNSCHGVKKILLLMREKKGVTAADRMAEIFKLPIFDKTRKEHPEAFQKVVLMNGDCLKPDLGLNEDQLNILKTEVNVILHVAATVRFDEHLRKAAYINVRCIKDMMSIAKEMKQLKMFVHVSTAYSHCDRQSIDEAFFETPMCPDKLLTMVELLNDEQLDNITPFILGKLPNTYVFTKAVAEEVIRTNGKGLPIVLVRPSIVVSTAKDPVSGWIDNIYGPTGVLYGGSLGLLHILRADSKCVADLVPADYVVNTILTAPSKVYQEMSKDSITNMLPTKEKFKTSDDVYIFNYVSGPENPITWGQFHDFSFEYGDKYRPIMQIWYSFFIFCKSYYLYMLGTALFHFLPAYIVDFITKMIGKKPIMVKAYKKIHKFSDVITFFAMREWIFSNENTKKLWNSLDNEEKEDFQLSATCFHWRSFFEGYVHGGRVYFLKDPMETLPRAHRKHKMFAVLHYSLVFMLLYLLYKFISLFL